MRSYGVWMGRWTLSVASLIFPASVCFDLDGLARLDRLEPFEHLDLFRHGRHRRRHRRHRRHHRDRDGRNRDWSSLQFARTCPTIQLKS